MSAGRHRKTLPWQVRLQRWGALAAAVITAAAVVPVAHALEQVEKTGTPSAAAEPSARPAERAFARTVSRNVDRQEPPPPTMAEIVALDLPTPIAALDLVPRWVTAPLNVWRDASEKGRKITVLDPGSKVQFTGTVRGGWAQIVRGDTLAWVHKDYLSKDKKPVVGPEAGVSGSPCADGSSVESGLVANTIAVYRSVCAAFPAVSSWGGNTGSGDHGAGRALDIMVTGSLGDAIAAYVRAHASELGVSEVIWSQQIWTVQRSSEGWRYMSDRGSSTANHYDHVHVSVY